MTVEEIRPILQALADGHDPRTGEVFPDDSPYQRGDVVRALYVALKSLSTRSRPPSHGRAWDADEDRRLADAFKAGVSGRDLASVHGRSTASIEARLFKLGLVPSPPPGARIRRQEAFPVDAGEEGPVQ